MLSAGAAAAVGLVVVACLIVIVLVVVLRWRRRLQQNPTGGSGSKADAQQEMEWDNSALNITVNPLDIENGLEDDDEFAQDGGRFALSADELDDDDVAACPAIDDAVGGLELDEQTTKDEKTECKELEWDDSTLSY